MSPLIRAALDLAQSNRQFERVAPDQIWAFGWPGEAAFAQAHAFALPDEFDLVRHAQKDTDAFRRLNDARFQ